MRDGEALGPGGAERIHIGLSCFATPYVESRRLERTGERRQVWFVLADGGGIPLGQ